MHLSKSGLVTIVLPTHNGSKYICESIDSCLRQTYDNLELIILDDASTDDTWRIINEHTDHRIHAIRQEVNRGLPETLNEGFRHAEGEFLTWTSDDNRYAPEAIAEMISYLDGEPSVGLVYADYWLIDETGKSTGKIFNDPPEKLIERDVIGACFLYRHTVYERIGNYDPGARLTEDYEFWLRVSTVFRIAHLPKLLYYYREHASSLTGTAGVVHERQRIIAKYKRKLYGFSWPWYQTRMAEIDIDEAFWLYQHGQMAGSLRRSLRGIMRNPTWLSNRGVCSITAKALLQVLRGKTGLEARAR